MDITLDEPHKIMTSDEFIAMKSLENVLVKFDYDNANNVAIWYLPEREVIEL